MTSRAIRFNDLSLVETGLSEEVANSLSRVVSSGWYVLGPEVEAFEKEFAETIGTRHAVGTASGTDAISLALIATGVSAGDEVVTSPLTATFTALAISRTGARPVFADVEPNSLTLSAESVERKITPRTKAMVPVHLYGSGCDIEALDRMARERELLVIEDACQAHGATHHGTTLGGWGAAGTFSFYPTKNLGGLGDGGIVTTNDEEIASLVRRLRNGGQASRYVHEEIGVNSRLDEIQAAVLRAKLPYLEAWNRRRRELAERYEAGLASTAFTPVAPLDPSGSARHLFVIRTPEPTSVMAHLRDHGVDALVHYPIPAHLQPAYRHLGQAEGSCPNAEAAAKSMVSLPLYPSLSNEDIDYVVRVLTEF